MRRVSLVAGCRLREVQLYRSRCISAAIWAHCALLPMRPVLCPICLQNPAARAAAAAACCPNCECWVPLCLQNPRHVVMKRVLGMEGDTGALAALWRWR